MPNTNSGLKHNLSSNLYGKKFGFLTVIGYVGVRNRRNRWLCQCDCGNKKEFNNNMLTGGRAEHCSARCNLKLPRLKPADKRFYVKGLRHHKVKNLKGSKFGSLTVINIVNNNGLGRTLWLCLCDCGGFKEAHGDHLKRGAVKYCSKKCKLKPNPFIKFNAKNLSLENNLHEVSLV